MSRITKIWEKIKAIGNVIFYDEIDKEVQPELKLEEKPQVEFDDYSALELEPVRTFLEDFTGVLITKFVTYDENVKDLEADIKAKMVVGIELVEKDLWIKLSKMGGAHGGYLKISPTVHGQFTENSNR